MPLAPPVLGVVVLDALDAAAVRRWSRAAVEQLDAHRSEIDALNVFPVPDSDTGTNLLMTLRCAEDELLAGGPVDAAQALAAMAAGATLGAVGNSGFIISQVLRGLADAAASALRCDGPAVAAGLDAGATLARAAVVTPVEGTILTVARAAADNASGTTLAEIVTSAVAAADAALQRTTAQLAQLAAAGVVDAGGRGFVVLLDALARIVTGQAGRLTPVAAPRPPAGAPPFPVRAGESRGGELPRAAANGSEDAVPGFGYEVQYLLDATAGEVEGLRRVLERLGDSVAVVAVGEGLWKVHVHVDDVGGAIEAAVEAGRPHRIEVVRFATPAAEYTGPDRRRHGARDSGARDGGAHRDDARDGARQDVARQDDRDERPAAAVVAVAPGAGLAHLFEAEGVHVVEGIVQGSPTTDEVVETIHATGARELVLLPNAAQVTGIAHAAAVLVRAQGVRVSVVPTRSPVQGLAAIAVHDATRRFDDDVVAMAEAAAATRFAELTIAQDEALTAVGICQPGDILGLIDGEVVEIGRGMLAVAFNLVDRLLGVGADLMTVVVGAGAPRRAGELIEAHIRGRSPLTDISVYEGGQPDHAVIIGVE